MGFRTVVMLHNDYSHEWAKDPTLGERIRADMNYHEDERFHQLRPYGRVVECVHADTFTLARLGGYDRFAPMGYSNYSSYDRENGLITQFENNSLKLLKQAADDLGYRLVKKGK